VACAVDGRTYRWTVAAATAAALAVRLVYAFAVEVGDTWHGDAAYYHYQASYLVKGAIYVDPFVYAHHPHSPLAPSAVHPPLFTAVLALGDLLGLRSMGAQKVVVVLIGTATVPVLSALARRVAGARAGAVAAVLAALYPGLWIFDGQVLSEALVIALAAAFTLAVYRWRARPSARWAVAVGALCALCALTRAEMALLVLLVVVPAAWGLRRDGRRLARADRLRAAVGVLAVAGAVVAPWVVRNLVVFDHPVLLSDQLDITLAAANNEPTYYGQFFGSWCYPCVRDVRAPAGDESDQALFWRARAERYVRAHLSRLPTVVGARVGLTWGLYAPIAQANASRIEGWPVPVTEAWLAWWYPLLALSVAGVVLLRRRGVAVYPLVALFAIATAAVVVTYGNFRFRAEAEMSTVVLGAVALDALIGVVARDRGAGREVGTWR